MKVRVIMESSESISIRPCREEDLEHVVALLADDELGSGRESATTNAAAYADAFRDIDQDPRNTVFLAEGDGRVLGCYQLTIIANLTFEGGRRALIEGVRVAEFARGKGIGEKMMDHAIAIAREQSCRIVQLTSNKQRSDALRFYERLGFIPSHVGFKLYL